MDVNQTHTHVKTLHSTWMSVILTSMSQAVIDTDVREADMDVQCDMGVNTVDTHVKTQNRLTHTHDMDVKCFDTHVHQRHSWYSGASSAAVRTQNTSGHNHKDHLSPAGTGRQARGAIRADGALKPCALHTRHGYGLGYSGKQQHGMRGRPAGDGTSAASAICALRPPSVMATHGEMAEGT